MCSIHSPADSEREDKEIPKARIDTYSSSLFFLVWKTSGIIYIAIIHPICDFIISTYMLH